ncbi:unnamed protein product [Callosobruchus maculatus]|uniref:Uncharacterized protein n=1 Tax=Callosobruchus maculatus TaxID=64391 RepID=A0A653CST3_CALMS|nr:unnamed protein product [Callosobruchus maculatus]
MDKLNISCRGFVTVKIHFFKNISGMSSGPALYFPGRLLILLNTSASENWWSCMSLVLLKENVDTGHVESS